MAIVNLPFKIKKGDLRPYLPFWFFEPDGTTPLDLTNATSVMIVVSPKNASPTDPPKFKKACSIIDAPGGHGEYHWTTTDTDTVGDFNYEFEIQWPSSEPQTIPADSYLVLTVVDDLG